jgi:hypothetical protein
MAEQEEKQEVPQSEYRGMGRPTKFTPDKQKELLQLIATTPVGTNTLCSRIGIRPDAFWSLFHKNADFRDKYAKAKELQADAMFDQIVQIADDGENDTYFDDKGNVKKDWDIVQRSQLRIDTRKWILARMNPKKYGDKASLELTTPGESEAEKAWKELKKKLKIGKGEENGKSDCRTGNPGKV